MRTKQLFILIGASIFAGLFFIFSPVNCLAQEGVQQTEKQKKALEMLRENQTASSFYDRLLTKESDWQLTNFFPPHHISLPTKKVKLDLQKGKDKVNVYINEYATLEEAKGLTIVNTPLSGGIIKNYNQYGEEGRKIYGNKGFSSIAFRKGRFTVSIYCDDEKTADRLAGYAADIIAQ